MIRPALLRHRDAHVRLLTALCLGELLSRPIEMPYDEGELKVGL